MNNKSYDNAEKTKLSNEIAERENVITNYNRTGFLDRNHAITLIASLKESNEEVKLVSLAKEMQYGTVNLFYVSDSIIISNLQLQVDVLKMKLGKMELEKIK